MNRLYVGFAGYIVNLTIILILLLSGSHAICQQRITGIIRTADNLPLEGVTITVQNSNRSAVSGAGGSFLIFADPGEVLIFSFVGAAKKMIRIQDQSLLNVTMVFNIASLENVVAIGYGTSKRKDITGAVDKVTSKNFNTGVIANPLQQLQGKVAGLVIVQPGGDPNGDFTVRVRGATSLEGQPPLLVIDGIAIDDFYKALGTLNLADIESYDILKDASAAAIYGSRGANGVILVTTKKATEGKISVNYNALVTREQISHRLDVLNADEWRKATASMNAGSLDAGANTDWQKQISQTGFSQSHTISIGWGSDQLNIHGSVGYIKQQGTIIGSGKEVITSRINAVQKSLKNKLEIRYGINTSTAKRDFLPDQRSTDQSRTGGSQIFGSIFYLPVWPAYNPDGSYYAPPTNSINPLFILKEIYSKQRENFFQGSFKADYELLKGLKLGALVALSKGNDVYDRYVPVLPGTNSLAEASKDNYNKQNFSGDIHGNYRKSFHRHTIDFTGVYEYNKYLNDGFGLTARGFLVPDLLNNNLGTATNVQTNDIFSYKNEVKLISFLGRLIYNYNDRYILTANFRRDGSSKFGPNKRWGNFPSVAVGWNAGNEKFIKNIKWLDNLKLRISYGLTGNQENLPPNNYQQLYGPAGSYLYNGQFYQSYAVTQENNPDLKWEVRKSFNIGIDFSLLQNSIDGTIDFFSDHTNDMLFLYNIPQPPFLTTKVYANAASAINRGVEISINSTIAKNKNFTWKIQVNAATLKNHITKLLGQFKGVDLSLNDPSYGYAVGGGFGQTAVTKLAIGHPAGVFWLPQHAGIDADGHELYKNYDAKGIFIGTSTSFTNQDKVFIDPTPKFTWGLTNNFSFRNFNLSFLLRGVQGQKIFANTLLGLESIKYLPGYNVDGKALTNGFADLPQASSYWLKNGSYARLENISVGYDFKNITGISNIRFYLAATNLFIITNYKGVDPEVRTEGNERYIDFLYYPKSRGFTLGVNVAF